MALLGLLGPRHSSVGPVPHAKGAAAKKATEVTERRPNTVGQRWLNGHRSERAGRKDGREHDGSTCDRPFATDRQSGRQAVAIRNDQERDVGHSLAGPASDVASSSEAFTGIRVPTLA